MGIEWKDKVLAEWICEWIVLQLHDTIDWNKSNAERLSIQYNSSYMKTRTSSNKFYVPKLLDFVSKNIDYIQPIQENIRKHIQDIYDGQKKIDELDQKFDGNNFEANSFGLNHSDELLEKINQIKFGFEKIVVGNDKLKLRTVIQQKVKNFEQIIYKDFMDHLNEQQRFIICTKCGGIIADATNSQIYNFYHKGVALHNESHGKTCQGEYRREQATLRKQAWRAKNSNTDKEESN